MDWTGQKLAESLCIYLTLGFGLVAFVVGYARQDFGLMMKVREKKSFRSLSIVLMERQRNASSFALFQRRHLFLLCLQFAYSGFRYAVSVLNCD